MPKLRFVMEGIVFTSEKFSLGKGAQVTITMPQALKSLSHVLLVTRIATAVTHFVNWHKNQTVGVCYDQINYEVVFSG